VIKSKVQDEFKKNEKEALEKVIRHCKLTRGWDDGYYNPGVWDETPIKEANDKLIKQKKDELINDKQIIVQKKKGVVQAVYERALEEDEAQNEKARMFRLKKDLEKKQKIENKFYKILKDRTEKKRCMTIQSKLNAIGLGLQTPENLGYVAEQVITQLDKKITEINLFTSKLLRDKAVIELCKNDVKLIDSDNHELEKEIDQEKLTKKGLTKGFMEEKTKEIMKNSNDRFILTCKIEEGSDIVKEKENRFAKMIEELREFVHEDQLGTLIVPDDIFNTTYLDYTVSMKKKMKGVDISKYDFESDKLD
jgi:hypothetical protein